MMRSTFILIFVLTCGLMCHAQKPLLSSPIEKFQSAHNPWGGVDGQNFLRVLEARAAVVTNEGKNAMLPVPCTPNAVDLNGDGLLDLVVVDARGFTWFYANQGTKTEPRFSSGEIIPIMLSRGGAQCPGMEAVMYDDNGLNGLVYGDWLGQIFYVPNLGSKAQPRFTQPRVPEDYLVPTSLKGKLWGNYFFPTVYDWDGDGRKDLIVGEGTYSANSIWLYLNQGSNSRPQFNEKEGKRFALVRGLGREHLTPVVLDWNGDGRPDIVTGERTGGLSVYINESAPGAREYKFREPVGIKLGTQENAGALSRMRFADINGDGLPDALVGRSNGRIGIALNKGGKAEPLLDSMREVSGINPFPPYAASSEASLDAPTRSTFHLLKVVSNNKDNKLTFEEGYEPPPGSKGTHSLKLEFYDTKPRLFSGIIPLTDDPDDEHGRTSLIHFKGRFSLLADKDYTISFWTRGSGFRRLAWNVHGSESFVTGKDEDGIDLTGSVSYNVGGEFGASSAWTNVRGKVRITREPGSKFGNDKPIGCTFTIRCEERGTLYLDDVLITEGNNPF